MATKSKRPKCTVKFYTDPRNPIAHLGPVAVLWHRGRALNTIPYPKGAHGSAPGISVKERVRARRMLMRGCTELVQKLRRS
jgi:hypothetical protein